MKFSNTVTSALATAVFGFAALGLTSTPAVAATTTAQFQVKATVVATCSIGAADLPFGSYLGVLLDVTSYLTVTCTNSTPYNIGFDAGLNAAGVVTARKMKGASTGAPTLPYALFRKSDHTLNWGTVPIDTLAGTGTGVSVQIPVYGEIAAGLTPVVDSYTDTITATLTY